MSTPSITTLPLSGLSRPIRHLSSTDLPVPDGPSITQISPAGTVRVTSPQISCLPKLFVRSLISISTPIELPLPRSWLGCWRGCTVVRVGLPTHAYQRVAGGQVTAGGFVQSRPVARLLDKLLRLFTKQPRCTLSGSTRPPKEILGR